MSSRHRLLSLALAILVLSSPAMARENNTIDAVLSKHLQAMGGEEQIESLRNLSLRLAIWEPEFEVEGHYRASTQGLMRIDIYAGEQLVFSEGIDATGGWQQNGAGTEVLGISEAGLLALERGIDRNLKGLMAPSITGGEQLSLTRQTLEGIDYLVIEAAEADGGKRQLYIHPETWLIERSREIKALHPDIDATEISTEERHSDFRPLCGVQRSFASENFDSASGELIQSTRIISADCNLDDEDLDLARPNN